MSKKSKASNAKIEADTKVMLGIETKGGMGMDKTISLNSYIEEVMDDGYLLLHMPLYKGYHYTLPYDTPVLLYFSASHRMFSIKVKFQENIKRDDLLYVKVKKISEAQPNQRRNCYRLECSLPITIERHNAKGAKKRQLEPSRENSPEGIDRIDEQENPVNGQTINFSDGGMLLTTNEDIEVGEKISLLFTLYHSESVDGTVLRSSSEKNGAYKFIAAVQFTYKDKAKKNRFYKYIMDQQREKIRRQAEENMDS